jgi:hypothetical protein
LQEGWEVEDVAYFIRAIEITLRLGAIERTIVYVITIFVGQIGNWSSLNNARLE